MGARASCYLAAGEVIFRLWSLRNHCRILRDVTTRISHQLDRSFRSPLCSACPDSLYEGYSRCCGLNLNKMSADSEQQNILISPLVWSCRQQRDGETQTYWWFICDVSPQTLRHRYVFMQSMKIIYAAFSGSSVSYLANLKQCVGSFSVQL